MEREIVRINEELCDGCGNCIPGCHEGALQVIDGKARLISDLMCDGLGACIGHCPQGAISIEKREAEEYDEVKVIEQMVEKGANTVYAHLKHLKEHNENELFDQAIHWLRVNSENIPFDEEEVIIRIENQSSGCGDSSRGQCAGSQSRSLFRLPGSSGSAEIPSPDSALNHWPVQMHLINPSASFYKNADLVLAADCVAFSHGNFHQQFLKGNPLAIACPKLDQGADVYIEKIRRLIDDSGINTLHLIIMEVPCCGGLEKLVRIALSQASRRVPVKRTIISIRGEVLGEEWLII